MILNTFPALEQYLVTKVGLSKVFLLFVLRVLSLLSSSSLLLGFILMSLIENLTLLMVSLMRLLVYPLFSRFLLCRNSILWKCFFSVFVLKYLIASPNATPLVTLGGWYDVFLTYNCLLVGFM